jgi:hypothetical protein
MGLEFTWEPMVYRNKLGRIIEADELEILLRDNEYRVIKQDVVGPYFISTVWLGVPFGMGTEYFETIVFETPEGAKDPREKPGDLLELYRYATIKEAEEGHDEVVKEWSNK